eukprot:1593536-Pleurochrysis_carterae.AAC.8
MLASRPEQSQGNARELLQTCALARARSSSAVQKTHESASRERHSGSHTEVAPLLKPPGVRASDSAL